jgi:hypothetical protein
MVYGSIWLVALVKGAGSVAGLEDFDGRVRGFLQDVQVAVGPCGVGGKKKQKNGGKMGILRKMWH